MLILIISTGVSRGGKHLHELMAGVIQILQDKPQAASIKTSPYHVDVAFKNTRQPQRHVPMVKDAIHAKGASDKAVTVPPVSQEANFARAPARLLYKLLVAMTVGKREDADNRLPDGYNVATRYPVVGSKGLAFFMETKVGRVILRREFGMKGQKISIMSVQEYQLVDVRIQGEEFLREAARPWNIDLQLMARVAEGQLQRALEWKDARAQRRVGAR